MDAWRTIDDRLHAWFTAPSHAAGAALLARIVAIAGRVVDVDVRAGGVRVRLDRDEAGLAPSVSAAAVDLGLVPAPHALQAMRLVLETPDPDRVAPFWALALGYDRDGTRLHDPWRRDLPLVLERDREARPRRDRLHVDVVRPAVAVQTIVDAVLSAAETMAAGRERTTGAA